MTRKHFEKLALALKSCRPDRLDFDAEELFMTHWNKWELCVKAIAAVCKEENPRFSERLFIAACVNSI